MDTAIATTLRAAGDAPVIAITGIFRGTTCDLGLLRTGGRVTRSVDLYVPVGEEEALIARIGTGLPASFAPRRGAGVGGRAAPLTTTAGGGVEVSVRHLGPGWVIARARTVAVLSQPTDAADLRRRLRPLVPADAVRFRSDSNRVSYREQAASVTVSASDDNTAVTITCTSTC